MNVKQKPFIVNILKIGIINLLPSIAPVLIYTLLSALYNNKNIPMGFSLTYPYQYIFMMICSVIIVAQIKSETKNGGANNQAYSGVLIWLVIALTISVLSYINRESLLNLFNADISSDTEIFMYGIAMLTLDYTVYYTVNIWQYQEKFKKSFVITVIWYVSRGVIALIVPVFIKSYKQGLWTIVISQTIMLLIFLLYSIRIQKLQINIRDGIKYSVASLPTNALMSVIYIFGYVRASSVPGGYFQAYNIEALCTDTQWDILSSGIDTAVTTEICKNGTRNKKQYIISAILYSILLYISSALMLLIYLNIYTDVDATKTWIIFLLECTGFPIYAIMYSIEAEVVILKPIKLIAVLAILRYVLRTIVTTFVNSPYAISFGVLTSLTMSVIQWSIVYKVAFHRHR